MSDAPQDLLRDRYGADVNPQATRIRRIIAASIGGAIALALAIWIGAGLLRPTVTGEVVGFTVRDTTSIDVVFDVTKAPEATAVCTIEALSSAFAQVGLVDVEVGPSEGSIVRVTAEVATSEAAVSGVVRACRLTD